MQWDDELDPQREGTEEEQAPEAVERQVPEAEKAAPRRTRAAAAAGPSRRPRSTGRAPEGGTRRRAPAEQGNGTTPSLPPRLLTRYREDIRPSLVREFSYSSSMQAPNVVKVVLNMGLGEALTNARALETAPAQMGIIAGQRPVITKARRSVANFKVREGMSIGCAVTLRGRRMWEFLDRFLSLALPRIRDFRGVSRNSFDGQGNYSVGIREQVIFPEIDYNNLDRVRGLEVAIVTSARSDREGFRLLEQLGMPFTREG